MGNFEYVGTELHLFAHCTRWKKYFSSQLAPHIGSDVVEVGAGIGANTSLLWSENVHRWVCVEPDPSLASQITSGIAKGVVPRNCEVRIGTSETALADETFDTAIYIDVLEHIEDDAAEAARITRHLVPGGKLIVLSPAHNFLYSPFDASIGHYRRYNANSMQAITATGTRVVSMQYVDSVGFFASLLNRAVLKQALPNRRQLELWDRFMVPVSRYIDPLLGFRFGKTIIGIWERL